MRNVAVDKFGAGVEKLIAEEALRNIATGGI
jgi:hypothetical protein